MLNKKKFAEKIYFLKKAIPKIDINIEVAYILLKELTEEQLSSAILDICRDKNFKLYDNVIGEIWDRGFNLDKINAEEAWLEVMEQIRNIGWCGQPFFSNYKILKAIEANGGWHKLCASAEIDWEKKRFIDSFKDFQDSEQAKIRQGLNPSEEVDNKVKPIMTEMSSAIG